MRVVCRSAAVRDGLRDRLDEQDLSDKCVSFRLVSEVCTLDDASF